MDCWNYDLRRLMKQAVYCNDSCLESISDYIQDSINSSIHIRVSSIDRDSSTNKLSYKIETRENLGECIYDELVNSVITGLHDYFNSELDYIHNMLEQNTKSSTEEIDRLLGIIISGNNTRMITDIQWYPLKIDEDTGIQTAACIVNL